jgi:hypothetical protein
VIPFTDKSGSLHFTWRSCWLDLSIEAITAILEQLDFALPIPLSKTEILLQLRRVGSVVGWSILQSNP